MNNLTLPIFLEPIYETDLVRVGNNFDGGYIIPSESLKNTEQLYSFGLNDNHSFEKDFHKKTNAKVICFDESVNFKFFLKKIIFGNFKKINNYIDYIFFFDGKKKVHVKKNIIPKNLTISYNPNYHGRIEDIESLMENNSCNKIFFKIDIEGSEYRLLDQLIKYQNKMTGLVIEFHNADLHLNKIKNFVEKLDLQIVHIHANNWGHITASGMPTVFEITFSPKVFNKKINNKKKYPINIDRSNHQFSEDLPLDFK